MRDYTASASPFFNSIGHQDAFLLRRLSGRYRFSEETFARTRGNGREAPKD